MKEQAIDNRTKIQEIKRSLDLGIISYDQAEEMAQPIIDSINEKSRGLAKKFGMRPQLVNFRVLMR